MKYPVLFVLVLTFFAPSTFAQTDSTSDDFKRVSTKVEREAKFPGGPQAWGKFVSKNLNPNTAVDAGARPGVYTVTAQFIVTKDGKIGNISFVEIPKKCKPCAIEVARVLRLSPDWEPAFQDNENVLYHVKQSVSFQVVKE